MRPFCILRNLVRLGCNICQTLSAITARARGPTAFLKLLLATVMGRRIVLHDFAFEDPGLDTDDAIGGLCLGMCVVDVGTKGMERHAAFPIPFSPRNLGATKAARDVHPDAERTHAHGVLNGTLHGTTERHTTLELLSNALCNQTRVQFGLANLDDVEVQFAVRDLGQFLAQAFDVCTLLADDHTRTCRMDRHTALLVRTLDDDLRDTSIASGAFVALCDMFPPTGLDVFADLDVFQQQITVVLGVCIPAAVPGAVDLETHTDGVYLMSHYEVSSTWRTVIVNSANGLRILPNRPRARGRPRFMVRFLPTQASATIRSSTSRPWLFSAFAMAD
mmetsp:Transcript_6675/g.11652  ORF Transcript_6675/g.11652 Transcript_6675/m.11652 type:complete len:333 (-) Transcript_6675:1468-2466(-)